jgi:DNA-binding transcriptional LysR family regulator
MKKLEAMRHEDEIASGLELRHLRTFRMVAGTGNFTRAGAELGYSQSTVTTHIKTLERTLGAELFERSRFSKQIVLTEAGKRVLKYSEKLLALADETVQQALSGA